MSYLYDPADGKIHTRYSELMACTTSQVWRVIAKRMEEDRLRTPALMHGKVRHEMWDEEARASGLLPAVFGLNEPVAPDDLEKEIVGEILPGVVLHGRIDALQPDFWRVNDYKTMIGYKTLKKARLAADSRYGHSKQLQLYAYLLMLNGYRITEARYLVEFWTPEYESILGYHTVIQPVNMRSIGPVLAWAEDRVSILVSAIEGAIA